MTAVEMTIIVAMMTIVGVTQIKGILTFAMETFLK